MPKIQECLCSQEIPEMKRLMEDAGVESIMNHPDFNPVCLDELVLRTAYFHNLKQYNQRITDENNCKRYTAYRQLARFAWGYLGKDIRAVLPACAVSMIWRTFPSIDGQYTRLLEPE